MKGQKQQASPATRSDDKERTRLRIRHVRSVSELTDDELFCMRSTEVRERRHSDGRVERTLKFTLYSERDSEKMLKFRDALKAAGRWPSNGGGAVR